MMRLQFPHVRSFAFRGRLRNLLGSGSQTCSSRYPNQGGEYFLLPRYFAVLAHNIEQHCGFGSTLFPEESHITPKR